MVRLKLPFGRVLCTPAADTRKASLSPQPSGTWTARTNSAYQAQANCYGSSTANAGPLTTYFVKGGGSITDVHFPSRLVGIAVGAGCSGGSTAYTDSTTGAAVSAVAVGAASLNYIPQILLTFDMGTTWQVS